jgi:mRNA interferase MazF
MSSVPGTVNELNQSAAEPVVVLPVTSREKGVRSHVEVGEGEAGLAVRSFTKCEDIHSISVGGWSGAWGRFRGQCSPPWKTG